MADRARQNLIFAHQEWIGFVQPVGLVLAPSIMVDAQVAPDRNVSGRQRDFRELLEEDGSGVTARWRAPDLRRLFIDYLGWEEGDLVDSAGHRDALEISLPELQVVLSPTWAAPAEGDSEAKWLMLVRVEEDGVDLDAPPEDVDAWNASRHARFERLLRETNVAIGLLCTDDRVRLIYAPKGESSGHITFDFSEMALPAGRPILAAFDMLLSADALFVGAEGARLPALLAKSREAQAEVSTRLARQVLGALYELLRGFVAADARIGGGTLLTLARQQPDHLYGGLITSLMRLVFVLYTEDRGLMPDHPVYQQHYSLGGLFARLRTDAAAYPDTMDQRFGAWAQLLSLFGLIHGGGSHAGLSFVARKGQLFDPDRFPFLEGRTAEGEGKIPMVPDATVWNVLQNLMMLDGERLSYRTLDVEQIGSVYEAIMGFQTELTTGRSIAVRSQKRTGAAVVIDLDSLLALDGGKRAKALQDATEQKLTGNNATALRNAETPADIVAALDRKVDRAATPDILPVQIPVLQPTDERRRSGSHYTPRSLTEPIVSEALRPIFERLGPSPIPEQILDLKILDPAMGSGAFLVEACRQVAAKLVDAWNAHGGPLAIPPDEDELLHARRLVAQRCLYGVDKNPMAVDLARLSLWLATLAKDHEFTFIDHALRHGDSLVGLSRRQIEAFHWEADAPQFQAGFETIQVRQHVAAVAELRKCIREAKEGAPDKDLRQLWDNAQLELSKVQLLADLVLAAYFEGEKPRDREEKRSEYADAVVSEKAERYRGWLEEWRYAEPQLAPFHWEIEFPEVFERENAGFDAIIGNPPFLKGGRISSVFGDAYLTWLKSLHEATHGNADLVAHFFRRAWNLVRQTGVVGLIATNTISQGDTRNSSLRWICENGGIIYNSVRRLEWPGVAAVVVSLLHFVKGDYEGQRILDSKEVPIITSFLFHEGGDADPVALAANTRWSFTGPKIYGPGFTFDDEDTSGYASPIAAMHDLFTRDARNEKRVFPLLGGREINNSPKHAWRRFVINFGEMTLEKAMCWPDLVAILRERVKPQRDQVKRAHCRDNWWLWEHVRNDLQEAKSGLDRVLVHAFTAPHLAFAFVPAHVVVPAPHCILLLPQYSAFAVLQSRLHEVWVRFFGSSYKDDLRYTGSDCFDTFPLPDRWNNDERIEFAGKTYYEFRAALMVRNNEGLTKTYNRFHDPDERDPEMLKLRELHAAMDRAVLEAYGWSDIPTDCEFLLDYEIDEEEWRKKKKPWRYRWPDEVRDEVLARLLALNAERAREEQLAGGDVQLMPEPVEAKA